MGLDVTITLVGTVAAACTTLAFVPQILRIRRQGGQDVSYGMLALYLAGVLLWLAYGLLTGARAVIAANAAAAVLVCVTLFVKWQQPGTRPRRRLRVAIDMDDVIADCLDKHLRVYNEAFAAALTRDALDGRSLEDTVPQAQAAAAADLLLQPGFFADLEEIEGSREAVRALSERYEVFIASAAMEVPTSFAAKYAWLRERFPFVPPSHIVFCGDKSVLDVDYLIDDTPRHFERFRGTAVLFNAPHNRDEHRYRRVRGWADVRALLLPSPAEGPDAERVAAVSEG